VNTNRAIADAVYELVASLGMQPTFNTYRAKLYGKDCGECYQVHFTPTMPVFRLARKLTRQRPTQRRTVRYRYIVDAVPVAPVPMRCAQVSSPSHLFLCSRAMIPTHNTRALAMEPARHSHVKGFTAVFFRRTYPEITNPDGLWDESKKVYGRLGWTMRLGDLEWHTPAGGRVKFAHAHTEADVESWKSAQIALLLFDQLETFSEYQFWYLVSRNRSTCGVRPYIRASFNCEPGWLADLLQWWWDPETGYPIAERDGVVRWLVRVSGEVHWGDSREELLERFGPLVMPLSFTFIAGRLSDNKILETKDPSYRAKLMALPIVEQERLLALNFKIRPGAGKVLPRAKFNIVHAIPTDIVRVVRGWDNAATQGAGDWSTAVKIGQRANGRYIILHRWRDQLATGERDEAMKNLAKSDGPAVEIAIAQEPGSAGKDVVFYTVTELAGFTVTAYRDTGDKVTRSTPFGSQLMVGNVDIFCWDPVEMEAYLQQVDAFPTKGVPDDDVDATTKAFKHLTADGVGAGEWGEEDFSII
jgi:predicted phage terminase large subunit-like protein